MRKRKLVRSRQVNVVGNAVDFDVIRAALEGVCSRLAAIEERMRSLETVASHVLAEQEAYRYDTSREALRDELGVARAERDKVVAHIHEITSAAQAAGAPSGTRVVDFIANLAKKTCAPRRPLS